MSEIVDVLETYIDRINRLKDVLKQEKDNVKKCCPALCLGDVKDMDYDEMKEFMSEIEKFLSSEQKAVFKQELSEKKRIKYPELNRAVYFPEINELDTSDEEKRRLDREIYKVNRYYFDEDFIKKSKINLSMNDIQKLYDVGVLEKYICFIHDGSCVDMVPEEEINALKEVWRLYAKGNFSTEELDHLDKLEMEYGCDLHLYYEEDWGGEDWSYDITCLEDYEEYEFKSEKYRVCKEPDTKYDNL